MTIPSDLIRSEPGLDNWCILLAYRGSIAHGIYEPNTQPGSIDDKDAIAVCVPHLDYYFGLREYGSQGTVETKRDPWDIVIYEAVKAIRLLEKGNPNILQMLWLPETGYLRVEEAGRHLIDHRDLFATRFTYYTFVGYARSQLTKMQRGDHLGYMGAKRRALVAQHGYDTKNASHLIRLLRMGIEFLRDGKLHVHRHDASELLAIKHGEWSLTEIKQEANRLFALAEEAFVRSELPPSPDRRKVNELAVEVVSEALGVEWSGIGERSRAYG